MKRIELEITFVNGSFKYGEAVRSLKPAGLDRKEIAGIFVKKPSDIDPTLYSKAHRKSNLAAKRVKNVEFS